MTNTGTAAATVSTIATTGDFALTSNCITIAPGASCTVNVTFTPIASGTRTGSLSIASNAGNSPTIVALTGTGAGSVNLALNQPTSASGYTQTYVPANAVDGNTSTYWESTDNAFPQWLQVDLGATKSFSRIVLDLPPSSAWGTRTQTLSILGSNDGSSYTTDRGVGRIHLQPINRQHGHHHLPRGQLPVRAAELHRQHRLACRTGLRVPGLDQLT